ncbi:MAG TPA: YetF domain-containing protein, partial [Myxococcota bacterium]|nr:YetF domain-containing protein [Myxococcota bacterium]
PALERVVKSRPALLLRNGRFEDAAMRRERVTPSEVRSAVRSSGAACLEDVAAVVLETDGSISVIRELGARGATALADVRGFEPAP